ncbi:MAG: peptidoglycan DL-endopeptidase CwlO, partial [Actinomycetota bacterium]|nr:peptidoglycan DL-endopeptidase CwlO [Actinomycetota bacterium]
GVAFGVVFLSVAACLSAIPALASPETDYANATAQAAKIQVQIASNSRRADILDEQYLIAQRAVTAAKRKITATQQQISVIEARARRLRDRLGSRAALLYIGAGNHDPIGINVSSVQDLGSRAQYADAAAAKDGHLLDDLKRADAQLSSQRDTLEGQLAAAQDQELAAEGSRRAVAQINASMQKLLDSTSANVRVLVAQIEQQALAAAAAAERAWLQRLAAEQASRRAHAPDGGATAPVPGDVGAAPGNLPAPTVGALAAVAYARAQLGKPYVYAAVGPDAFDCSGLTMMAWAQGGVLMEHGSQAQYNAFPHVPLDQLQPGDLVFFGTSGPANHHVGIVVGPGIMIDAPHTGAYVQLVSYFQPDLVLMGARP